VSHRVPAAPEAPVTWRPAGALAATASRLAEILERGPLPLPGG